MTNQNQVTPNCMVIMDLATEMETSKQDDVAKGILIGGLLGLGLTAMDRAALGAMLASIHLKQEKELKEVNASVQGVINFSPDEQRGVFSILRQAQIVDENGNLI